MSRKIKEFTAETEISRVQYDPTVTTVGEIVYKLWCDNPHLYCSRIRMIYKRNNPNTITKRSVSLSSIFDLIDLFRHYKSFAKSLLMNQFLILGVYMMKTVSVRGYEIYKLYLTDRDSLYEVTDEGKRECITNLFRGGKENEQSDGEQSESHLL